MECSLTYSETIFNYLHIVLNNKTPFIEVDKKKDIHAISQTSKNTKKQTLLFDAIISELNTNCTTSSLKCKMQKQVKIIIDIFFLNLKQKDDIKPISEHKQRLAIALKEHLETNITPLTVSESRRSRYSLSRMSSTSSSSRSSRSDKILISTCSSSSGESPHLQRSVRRLDLSPEAFNYYLSFWFSAYGQEKSERILLTNEKELKESGEYALMEQNGLFAKKCFLARTVEKQAPLALDYTNWDSLGLDIARDIKTIVLLDNNKDDLINVNWTEEIQDLQALFHKQIKYFKNILKLLMEYASIEKEQQLTTLRCWKVIGSETYSSGDNLQQHFGGMCGAFLKMLASESDSLPRQLLPFFQAMAQGNYMFPFRVIKRIFDNQTPAVSIPQKGQGQSNSLYKSCISFVLDPSHLTVQAMVSASIPLQKKNKIPACQLSITNSLSYHQTAWKAKLDVHVTAEELSQKKIKRIEARLIAPLTSSGFTVAFNDKNYCLRKAPSFYIANTISEGSEEGQDETKL